MKKQAFTLVELIVVITILAILGTIAFINLQGYSMGARDSKRISDVNNIFKKISIEKIKGISPSELIKDAVDIKTGLTIGGLTPTDGKQGKIDFQKIKENEDNFKDPKGGDYVYSYAIGGSGTGTYKFTQLATINEEKNESVVIGDYYKIEPTDSPSIIFSDPTNTGSAFVVNGGGTLLVENTSNIVVNYECNGLVGSANPDQRGTDNGFPDFDLCNNMKLDTLNNIPLSNSLSNTGSRDVYSFVLEQGKTYTLESLGDDDLSDTAFFLYDNLGNKLSINDDIDENNYIYRSRIIYTATYTGYFYLGVMGYDDLPIADYTLNIFEGGTIIACNYQQTDIDVLNDSGFHENLGVRDYNNIILNFPLTKEEWCNSVYSVGFYQWSTLNSEVYTLNLLKSLSITDIGITSIAPEIGNLTSLTNLNLSNNSLTNLPLEIGNLTNLTDLNLSGNLGLGNLNDVFGLDSPNKSQSGIPTVGQTMTIGGNGTNIVITITTNVISKYPGCNEDDIPVGSYVVASCNVGATIAGTDWTNPDTVGLYFQWGNNYGSTFNSPTTNTLADATGYGPGNYYSSTSFISGSHLYRWDWTTIQNDNLWGNTTNTSGARQGPCASGYHVPSLQEWNGLITEGGFGSNGTIHTELKLPYSGFRFWSDGAFYDGGAGGYYWSSTPSGVTEYDMYIASNLNFINDNLNRPTAISVRCFKD